jgi:hypothetical protein
MPPTIDTQYGYIRVNIDPSGRFGAPQEWIDNQFHNSKHRVELSLTIE